MVAVGLSANAIADTLCCTTECESSVVFLLPLPVGMLILQRELRFPEALRIEKNRSWCAFTSRFQKSQLTWRLRGTIKRSCEMEAPATLCRLLPDACHEQEGFTGDILEFPVSGTNSLKMTGRNKVKVKSGNRIAKCFHSLWRLLSAGLSH